MATFLRWIRRWFGVAPLTEEPNNKREQKQLHTLLQRCIRDCNAAAVAEIFNAGDFLVYMNISRAFVDHETIQQLRDMIAEEVPWYNCYLEYSPSNSELYERDSAESEDLRVYSR